MRALFIFSLCLGGFTSSAALIEWDPYPPEQQIEGYNVYAARGTNDAPLTLHGTTVATNYLLTNLAVGVWRIQVTAFGGGAEGPRSEVSWWTNFPSAPQVRIRVSLQSKENIGDPWVEAFQYVSVELPADRQRFFQARMEVVR